MYRSQKEWPRFKKVFQDTVLLCDLLISIAETIICMMFDSIPDFMRALYFSEKQ